ncbi:unnamed protein product [Amoebophrya sp. A25]|nr:unnamed protein product [Amoebophrya sp. A25]|eukprot:GSA25T00011770001.1
MVTIGARRRGGLLRPLSALCFTSSGIVTVSASAPLFKVRKSKETNGHITQKSQLQSTITGKGQSNKSSKRRNGNAVPQKGTSNTEEDETELLHPFGPSGRSPADAIPDAEDTSGTSLSGPSLSHRKRGPTERSKHANSGLLSDGAESSSKAASRLPSVDEVLLPASSTLSKMQNGVKALDARIQRMAKVDEAQVAKNKADLEQKLYYESLDLAQVKKQNAEIEAENKAVASENAKIEKEAKEVLAQDKGLRSVLESLSSKVAAGVGFSKKMDKRADWSGAPELSALELPEEVTASDTSSATNFLAVSSTHRKKDGHSNTESSIESAEVAEEAHDLSWLRTEADAEPAHIISTLQGELAELQEQENSSVKQLRVEYQHRSAMIAQQKAKTLQHQDTLIRTQLQQKTRRQALRKALDFVNDKRKFLGDSLHKLGQYLQQLSAIALAGQEVSGSAVAQSSHEVGTGLDSDIRDSGRN